MDEEKLDPLLDLWEEKRRQKREPSAEEMCAGAPELLDAFKEKIARLKLFDSVFGDSPLLAEDICAAASEFCNGRYQVEVLHDQGGLGALYLARDTELGRTVIVKGERIDQQRSVEGHKHLINEAAITAQLEHPGIVPVYSYGQDKQQRPYYAMRLIRGSTLREAIRKYHGGESTDGNRSVAFQRLLRDFLSVCKTIEFAHSRGVLHRDIKPANIMVGRFGEVLVVDWGLAKHAAAVASEIGAADETIEPLSVPEPLKTRLGSIKGSPMYMSPEQAAGRTDEIGPASDIYGLGATLYELLIGEAPYQGTSSNEIVERVKQGAMRPPRQVKPEIPPALEAICLKAMQLDPRQRYSTTKQLAADVESFLADEAVSAHVESLADKARRWGRRHRTLVTSAVATLLVAMVTLGSMSGVLARRNKDLAAAKTVAESAEQAERARAAELERSLYANQMFTAGAAWREADVHRLRKVLAATKPQLRNIEWNLADRLSQRLPILPYQKYSRPIGEGRIDDIVFSPNGKWLISDESHIMPNGTATGGKHLLSPIDGAPKLAAGVGFLAFDPTGTKILRREAADKAKPTKQVRVSLVDIATGQKEWESEPIADDNLNMFSAGFVNSSSATQAMVAVIDNASKPASNAEFARITLLDAKTGRLLKTIDGDGIGNAAKMQLSPDGKMLALYRAGGETYTVPVLSTLTGKTLFTLTGHTGRVRDIAFSNDNRRIATGSDDSSIRIWDATNGATLSVLWGTRGPVSVVAFSPTGDRVAGGSSDGAIRIWNSVSGELLRTVPVDEAEILALAFTGDGSKLYFGGTDGVIQTIELNNIPGGEILRAPSEVSRVRLSPTGDAIATIVSGSTSQARVYDRATGKLRFEVELYDRNSKSAALYVEDVAFSPDGQTLAISGDNFLRMVNAKSGKQLWQRTGLEAPMAFAASGKQLVAVRRSRDLIQVIKEEQLFDQVHGNHARTIIEAAIKDPGFQHGFTYPDGKKLLLEILEKDTANKPLIAKATELMPSALVVLDTTGGKTVRALEGEPEIFFRLAIHPRGNQVAISEKSSIRIVDLATGKQLRTFKAPQQKTWSLSYSPDGQQLMTVGTQSQDPSLVRDSRATVVDVTNGNVLLMLSNDELRVQDAAYSPDGSRIVTCGADGSVRIYDARSADMLWLIAASKFPLYSVAISKNAEFLAASGGDPRSAATGETLYWNVSPLTKK